MSRTEDSLRIYPLPYINFRLDHNHLSFISEQMSQIKKNTDLRAWKLRDIEDRMTGCLAFALVYGQEQGFKKITLKDWIYETGEDFTIGKIKPKILVSQVNPKWKNTGPSMVFRLGQRTFSKSKSDFFVLTAYNVPFIQFLGWLSYNDMKSYAQGYMIKPYASCLKLKPMFDHPIEEYRCRSRII